MALVLVVGLTAVGVKAFTVVVARPMDIELPVTALVVGLLLADDKPWWPWFHIGYALLLSGFVAVLLAGVAAWRLLASPTVIWASVLVGVVLVLGAKVGWLAAVLRKAETNASLLLLAVNALNIADAILTWRAVQNEGSEELNPLVRVVGLPGKVVIVLVASAVLYRVRPRMLLIAAGALGVVFAYHFLGLSLNT